MQTMQMALLLIKYTTLNSLDHQYITDNLSPGGCADLLAVSLMFYFLESAGMIADI